MILYNFTNQLERQFVVYCDFEYNLIKSERKIVLHTHEPNSVALYFVCTYNNNNLWSYVGKDCENKLLITLNELAEQCIEELHNNLDMIMSGQYCDNFDIATCCRNCK